MAIAVSGWSCARARRALSLVLDGEEPEGDVQSLAQHLGGCPSCRQFAAEVTAFTRALRSLLVGPLDITDEERREK
jgi:predicted anti-sigma-YlaC factor YlaD